MNETSRRRVELVVGDTRCDCAVDLVMTMQCTRLARAVHSALDLGMDHGEGWHVGRDGALHFRCDDAMEPLLFPIVLHYQLTGRLLYPWQYTREQLADVEAGAVATLASRITAPISVMRLQHQLDYWIDDLPGPGHGPGLGLGLGLRHALGAPPPALVPALVHGHPSTIMAALLHNDVAAAAQAQAQAEAHAQAQAQPYAQAHAVAACAMTGATGTLVGGGIAALDAHMQDPRYFPGATDVPASPTLLHAPPLPPPATPETAAPASSDVTRTVTHVSRAPSACTEGAEGGREGENEGHTEHGTTRAGAASSATIISAMPRPRLRWADRFGKELERVRLFDGDASAEECGGGAHHKNKRAQQHWTRQRQQSQPQEHQQQLQSHNDQKENTDLSSAHNCQRDLDDGCMQQPMLRMSITVSNCDGAIVRTVESHGGQQLKQQQREQQQPQQQKPHKQQTQTKKQKQQQQHHQRRKKKRQLQKEHGQPKQPREERIEQGQPKQQKVPKEQDEQGAQNRERQQQQRQISPSKLQRQRQRACGQKKAASCRLREGRITRETVSLRHGITTH